MTSSALLDRITFVPDTAELNNIPWPAGLAPTPYTAGLGHDGSLPPADVFLGTWTAAEATSLADVMSPGAPWSSWAHYGKNWAQYAKQLTGRSPAREAQRLGEFHMTRVGPLRVCLFHFQLHPATDAASLPSAQLAAQAATDTGARLVITTGTAGGAGEGSELGDVNVASAVHADFTTRLKGKPWSGQEWATTPLTAGQTAMLAQAPHLFTANSARLPEAPRQPKVWTGHTVSTDFFAFDAADDHYGLRAYDPAIRAVEMDDAAVAVGVLGLADPPAFASVRNASDPVMPDGSRASSKQAEQIYRKYGRWTTVNSAIAAWALIAGLTPAAG